MSPPMLNSAVVPGSALTELKAIHVGFQKDAAGSGTADAVVLKPNGAGDLRGARVKFANSVTYTARVTKDAVLSVEFSDWPPSGCERNRAIVLGTHFSFEDSSSSRLLWTVPAGTPLLTAKITYDSAGLLTISTVEFGVTKDITYDLKSRVNNNELIAAYVCLRYTKGDAASLG